ncbi:hypothetical protein [Thermococcus sp.]|jgi:hypothetical protein|uniref:hypothetical protein n=1 Tax=Thermococcus sp. TaxID=35749 RepID=UPI002613E763|nr:hypothetical protein [Thermococcus sp.]
MEMERRVFRDYLLFTVPHVTVFAGMVFGILLLVGVKVNLALGIFALVYGLMLLIVGLTVYPHFSKLAYYRLFLLSSLLLFLVGVLLLLKA